VKARINPVNAVEQAMGFASPERRARLRSFVAASLFIVGAEFASTAVLAQGQAGSAATAATNDADVREDSGTHATLSSPDASVTMRASSDASADAALAALSSDGGGRTTGAGSPPRKQYPAPPPPSAEQVAALNALRKEVDSYESGARAYRDTVTTIIKLHYETKKREVLTGLDREIAVEKVELKKARDLAIRRLEEFVSAYSGSRVHPEATPDALYRLAALYEERARSDEATVPIEEGLKDAIRLYKRILREHANYRELAGIYYFLGHALNDSGRMPEAQQVWRSLVCHNHYPYPTKTDRKDPDKDVVSPMPQDADEAYWSSWRRKYILPKSISRSNKETVYEEVYPDDCTFVAQPSLRLGEDPKYVAEVWWQIGNWEFDQLDLASGVTKEDPASVWGFNRAASAYQHGMRYKRPPLYGVALYKCAWTLFKQQRYDAATREFVKLLSYTDEQEKLTGDRGADFRSEAYTYIAGSLTNLDFRGPEEWEPFIVRPDIIDTEPNPDRAEQKLHVAIDRVRDASLIPQDKPWTIEVYRGLAAEFRALNHHRNAIEVYELMLQTWPMDPTAPETQNAVAETYDQINLSKKPGTPEHEASAQKALEARTKLAKYIGNTPWVDANKDNPAAIQSAERLVRGGLRQAAAQHTNNGKAALIAASETGDASRQIDLLSRAATEYRLASTGWYGYLKQDENAPDAYESRYWNADARRNYVRIQVKLHEVAPKVYPEPSKRDIDEALAAAVEVRDSNEDDTFLDNAAFFAVDISDVDRDLSYARYVSSRGAAGIERRDDVKFDSNDESTRNVVKDPIPPAVLQSMNARSEYVRAVPPTRDPQKRSLDYTYYVAEQFFLYGHWDTARERFTQMWKENCKQNEFGYKAWERLITMAAKRRDAEEALRLAEAEKNQSCAFSPEQSAQATGIIKPLSQEAAYVKARVKFEEARKAPPGAEKNKLWREAAALYEQALGAAPSRDEAPEGAMNAAYAYKQVGEYNKAIELYNRFISEYGSNERLTVLQKGDPKTKAAPDTKRYAERLKYLGDAYDALGTTYYSFFNYTRAAETYEKVSANERFDDTRRRDAAKNAMILYSNMGEREKMLGQYRTLAKLRPTPEDRADADYRVSSFDAKQWDAKAGDSGTNRQNRTMGETSLQQYYLANRANPGAAKFLIEAAYTLARLKRAGGEPDWRVWFNATVTSWEALRARSMVDAQKPPYVDYAAEAAFTLIDEEITAKFDTPEKHKYPTTVPEILGDVKTGKKGKYQLNAEDALTWDLRLENDVIKKYQSVEWVPAAFARQGAIFDTLRTGLYNTVKVKLFNAQGEKLLETMRNSGRDDLMTKADEFEDAAKDFWKQKKQQELDGADESMVRRYATSVAYATKFNVKSPQITRAIGRLAYYTDILGDAKLQKYVTNAPDPVNKGSMLAYAPNQFVQTRPGLTVLPAARGDSKPLPAAP
jgi:tetratricopeptide (TPR) repeat protein